MEIFVDVGCQVLHVALEVFHIAEDVRQGVHFVRHAPISSKSHPYSEEADDVRPCFVQVLT